MRAEVDTARLVAGLKAVAPAVSLKSPMPIHACVRLSQTEDGLALAAFDLETSIETTVPVDALIAEASEQTAVVSHRALSQVAGVADGKQVRIHAQGTRLQVESGRGSWLIPLLPPEDYPRLPARRPMCGRVDGAALADALAAVVPAAGTDESQASGMLTGVWFESSGEVLTLAATNRYCMHAQTIDWSPADDTEFRALVPARTLALLVRGLSGPLDVGLDGGLVSMTGPAMSISTRRMDDQGGKWLPWRQFFDGMADARLRARLDRRELARAAKQASVLADKLHHLVVTLANGVCEVTSTSADSGAGSSTAVLDADLDGPPIRFGCDTAYLLAALDSFDSELAELALLGPLKPFGVGPAGGQPVATVMPVRREESGWLEQVVA